MDNIWLSDAVAVETFYWCFPLHTSRNCMQCTSKDLAELSSLTLSSKHGSMLDL